MRETGKESYVAEEDFLEQIMAVNELICRRRTESRIALIVSFLNSVAIIFALTLYFIK